MSGYATLFELSAQPMPDCFNGSLRKTICEEIRQDTGGDTELQRASPFAGTSTMPECRIKTPLTTG
jgi:hypothetical protein